MGTIDRVFGQREMSEEREIGKATERGRSQALAKFGAIGGALAFMLLLTFVTSPPAGHAALPGANGKIAFVSNRDGNFEIYVMNADGSGQTRCTNDSIL